MGRKKRKAFGLKCGVGAWAALQPLSFVVCYFIFLQSFIIYCLQKNQARQWEGRKERRFINESTHEIAFPGSFHAPSTALGLCVIETLYARSKMKWKDMLAPSSSHECSIFSLLLLDASYDSSTHNNVDDEEKRRKKIFPFLFSLPIKIIDDDEQCSFVHLVLCSFLFIWTHLFLLLPQSYYRSSFWLPIHSYLLHHINP